MTLTRDELKASIKEYLESLQGRLTDEICLCTWIHRDMLPNGKPGKILSDVNEDCPIHSQTGLLLHFITSNNFIIRDVEPAGRVIEKPTEKAVDVDGTSW